MAGRGRSEASSEALVTLDRVSTPPAGFTNLSVVNADDICYAALSGGPSHPQFTQDASVGLSAATHVSELIHTRCRAAVYQACYRSSKTAAEKKQHLLL